MTPASATALDARGARRRFLLLRGVRWLPTGLLIPVLVLLLLDRGLTLGQIGLVTAAQGLVVMLLELPTGALADALGRRRVLLGAIGAEAAAVALLIVADSLPAFVVVFAVQGVYRALDSGPLDAWYVDTAQAAEPDADIERGLATAASCSAWPSARVRSPAAAWSRSGRLAVSTPWCCRYWPVSSSSWCI